MNGKGNEVKALPTSGLIKVNDLAEMLGIRRDNLQLKLKQKGIPTLNKLGPHFRLLNVADLK